jgi:hypothetical protein
MQTLTIKLLHERRANSNRRKIDGHSGKNYPFIWDAGHDAYVFTTEKQEEADDLFNSQGRSMGSYFAPVITIGRILSDATMLTLLKHAIRLPDLHDPEDVAKALVESFNLGVARGEEKANQAILALAASAPAEPAQVQPQKPKGKSPPPTPPIAVRPA